MSNIVAIGFVFLRRDACSNLVKNILEKMNAGLTGVLI